MRAKEEKRAKSYVPPKEVEHKSEKIKEPSLEELKNKFLKKRKIRENAYHYFFPIFIKT